MKQLDIDFLIAILQCSNLTALEFYRIQKLVLELKIAGNLREEDAGRKYVHIYLSCCPRPNSISL